MNAADAIRRYFKQATLHTFPGMDEAVFDRMVVAQQTRFKDKPASPTPVFWRDIMRSPITRLAIAAGLILGIMIVIGKWGGSIDGTSMAWARVAQKVRAIETYTYRQRQIETTSPRQDGFEFTSDMESIYHCSKRYGMYVRTYRNGQPFVECYGLLQTRQWIVVGPPSEHFSSKSLTDADLKEMEDKRPQAIVMRVLSRDHMEIGPNRIDGRDVVGIETHDPFTAFLDLSLPLRDFAARLWIDAQTDLPVWVEISYILEGSDTHTIIVADQFQWNVDLDPRVFEPNVPAESRPVQAAIETKPPIGPSELAMQEDARSAPYLSDFDRLQRPKVDHIILLGMVPSPNPKALLMQEMEQIWKAQDGSMRAWPPYAQVRDKLYSELVDTLRIDQLSVEDLMATGIALREWFWAIGGDLSEVSYPYGYAARLACEIVHERDPENLAVMDQLVESILTTELSMHHEPNLGETVPNPVYPGLLADLRTKQFEQIKARVSAGAVPTWKDFVRVYDLAMLLGWARDFASGMQAFEWLIRQANRAGWTAYGRMLKTGHKVCSEGKGFNSNIFLGGLAFPEEHRYARRLPSFQGPENRGRCLLPTHLADPKDVSSHGF